MQKKISAGDVGGFIGGHQQDRRGNQMRGLTHETASRK